MLFDKTVRRNRRFDRLLIRTLQWVATSPDATARHKLGARILAPFMVPRATRPSLQSLIGSASASAARALLFTLLRHDGSAAAAARATMAREPGHGDEHREMVLGWSRVLDVAFHARSRRIIDAVTAFAGTAGRPAPPPTDRAGRIALVAADLNQRRAAVAAAVGKQAVARAPPLHATVAPARRRRRVVTSDSEDEDVAYGDDDDEDSEGGGGDGSDGDGDGASDPGGDGGEAGGSIDGGDTGAAAPTGAVEHVAVDWTKHAGMDHAFDARHAVAKLLGIPTPQFSLLEQGEAKLARVLGCVALRAHAPGSRALPSQLCHHLCVCRGAAIVR